MSPPKHLRNDCGATLPSLLLATSIVTLAFLHLGRGAVEATRARRERESEDVVATVRALAADRLEALAARLDRGARLAPRSGETLGPAAALEGLPIANARCSFEVEPPAGVSGLWWASVTATWTDTDTGERRAETVETHGHARAPAPKG